MNLTSFHFLCCLFAASLVLIAALHDYKWRLIPNILTIPSIVYALFIHTVHAGFGGFSSSFLGLLAGGGIFLLFYLTGGMGAGDVKLMGAVGAILGTNMIFTVLILTALIGGIMAIFQLILNARSCSLSRRFRYYVLTSQRRKNQIHYKRIVTERQSLPYGIAIALGTILTLILSLLIEVSQ